MLEIIINFSLNIYIDKTNDDVIFYLILFVYFYVSEIIFKSDYKFSRILFDCFLISYVILRRYLSYVYYISIFYLHTVL